MNKFSDYRATMGRFRTIGEEQNTYKESYMVLANFLTSLKHTQMDYQYFPTQQYMPSSVARNLIMRGGLTLATAREI